MTQSERVQGPWYRWWKPPGSSEVTHPTHPLALPSGDHSVRTPHDRGPFAPGSDSLGVEDGE